MSLGSRTARQQLPENVTTAPAGSGCRRRVYNRDWAYQKLLYCLDRKRSVPRTSGILLFGQNAFEVSLFCFDLCQPSFGFGSKAELLHRQMLAYHFTKNVPEEFKQPIRNSLVHVLPNNSNSSNNLNNNDLLVTSCSSNGNDAQSPMHFIVSLVSYLLNYHEEQQQLIAMANRTMDDESNAASVANGNSDDGDGDDDVDVDVDVDVDDDDEDDICSREKRRICKNYHRKWHAESTLRKSFDRIQDIDDLFRQVFIFPLLELEPPKVPFFLLIDTIDLNELASTPSRTISELIANNHHLLPKWLLLALTARKQTRAIVKAFTGFRRLNLAFENDMVESRPSSNEKLSLLAAAVTATSASTSATATATYQLTNLVEIIRNCNDNCSLIESFIENAQQKQNRAVSVIINECDSEGWTPLRVAAWFGYTKIVDYLLRFKTECDIDAIDEEKRTALRVASWRGYESIVRLLIDRGANINFTDRDGRTALIVAAHMGHFAIVRLLIENQADLHLTDIDGRSALMIASFSRQENAKKIVSYLLENGANVNQNDIDGATALLIAAHAGNKDVCETLLEYDADIEKTDDSGTNALWAAAGMGYDQVVELLLFWGSSIDLMDRDGRTVLSLAASRGHCDVVAKLLNRGLDDHHRDNAGWTPLHYATIENHRSVCELLLESGAIVDMADNEGRTAVMLAAEAGYFELVQLFVERYEAKFDRKPHDGRSALRVAAIENHFDIVNLLLANNADINSQDSDGRSILYILAWENNIEMTSHLIDFNANVELQDTEGRNALQVSAWQGHYDIVNLLLCKGRAKVDAVDHDNRTALHSASWQGHDAIVELLLKHKANPNHACKQGATALCIAAQEGHEQCVITLLKYGASPFQSDACGRTANLVAAKSGHERIVHLLEIYQQKFADKQLQQQQQPQHAKSSSPLYNSPPVSPVHDLQQVFDNLKLSKKPKNDTDSDKMLTRNGHMDIIMENSKIKNKAIQIPVDFTSKKSFKSIANYRSAKKPKRNGIVTNPALRLMAGVKSGFDSAAANLRKSSANPSQKTNSFQWKRETPL